MNMVINSVWMQYYLMWCSLCTVHLLKWLIQSERIRDVAVILWYLNICLSHTVISHIYRNRVSSTKYFKSDIFYSLLFWYSKPQSVIVGIKHLLTCKDAQWKLRIRSGRDQQWNGGEGTPGKAETKGWQSKERLWRTKRENRCKKKTKNWEVKKKSRTGLEVKSGLRGQDRGGVGECGGIGVSLTSSCIEAIQGHIMHHFIKTEQMW